MIAKEENRWINGSRQRYKRRSVRRRRFGRKIYQIRNKLVHGVSAGSIRPMYTLCARSHSIETFISMKILFKAFVKVCSIMLQLLLVGSQLWPNNNTFVEHEVHIIDSAIGNDSSQAIYLTAVVSRMQMVEFHPQASSPFYSRYLLFFNFIVKNLNLRTHKYLSFRKRCCWNSSKAITDQISLVHSPFVLQPKSTEME